MSKRNATPCCGIVSVRSHLQKLNSVMNFECCCCEQPISRQKFFYCNFIGCSQQHSKSIPKFSFCSLCTYLLTPMYCFPLLPEMISMPAIRCYLRRRALFCQRLHKGRGSSVIILCLMKCTLTSTTVLFISSQTVLCSSPFLRVNYKETLETPISALFYPTRFYLLSTCIP